MYVATAVFRNGVRLAFSGTLQECAEWIDKCKLSEAFEYADMKRLE